jgi:hypothetical protein
MGGKHLSSMDCNVNNFELNTSEPAPQFIYRLNMVQPVLHPKPQYWELLELTTGAVSA